jgi:cell division protein ZapB
MTNELAALETKVQQLVGLYQQSRDENRALRVRVATLEGERKAQAQKMADAKAKLDALADRLPVDAN